ISLSNKQSRCNLVVIPAANTSSLIEENKFTLIGPVTNPEVQNTRALVRVCINGLKPLEMMLDTTLRSGEIKKVELHYEKLEKHCFLFYSLTNENSGCPSNTSSRASHSNYMGINQTKTLESLEAYRRTRDERKA
ncbi:hypothetical protein IGI04_023146, partial [Brassica rapa subsp. trilocularis]